MSDAGIFTIHNGRVCGGRGRGVAIAGGDCLLCYEGVRRVEMWILVFFGVVGVLVLFVLALCRAAAVSDRILESMSYPDIEGGEDESNRKGRV